MMTYLPPAVCDIRSIYNFDIFSFKWVYINDIKGPLLYYCHLNTKRLHVTRPYTFGNALYLH